MRYVWREGELYEAHKAPPRPRGPRSRLSAPYIRTDGMDVIVNHANGLLYDSKSAYYRAVKDAGCEIVGDDPNWGQPKAPEFESPDGIEQDIKDATEQLEARL